MFIHGDILHVFSNMIGWLLFGATVENSVSKLKFLVIYFISGANDVKTKYNK